MEKRLELGAGLEIWRVSVDDAKEQDTNARAMPKAMMDRLAKTIEQDKRIESLPLCAFVEGGLEIVSGHHRFRSSRKAGLMEIPVLVDVTGLTRDQIAAKQLAHNSIAGFDDPQLVAKIFANIEDVRLKLEAFIDPEKIGFKLANVSVGQLRVGVQFEVVVINFFPTERTRFNEAIEALSLRISERAVTDMHISVLENYERFREAVQRTKSEYDIRSTGTAIDEMSRMVLEDLGEPTGDTDEDMLPLRSVFGVNVLPLTLANKLKALVKKATESGEIQKGEAWRLLEKLV